MPIHYGFTGNQDGMEPMQAVAVFREMLWWMVSATDVSGLDLPPVLHHGDCKGSDAQAHRIAMHFNFGVILHPMTPSTKRAWCQGAMLVHAEKDPMERNQDIVDESTLLLVTPRDVEVRRSGTWATVRRARKAGVPRRICWPDGSVTDDPESTWLKL